MSLGHECNLGDHRKKMLTLEQVQRISKGLFNLYDSMDLSEVFLAYCTTQKYKADPSELIGLC